MTNYYNNYRMLHVDDCIKGFQGNHLRESIKKKRNKEK